MNNTNYSSGSKHHAQDQAYVIKRRTVRTAMVVGLIVIVGGIGVLALNQQTPSYTPSTSNPGMSETDGGRSADSPSQSQLEEGKNTNRSLSSKNYLNDDGTVDYDAVSNLKNKFGASDMKSTLYGKLSDQFDQDVEDGVITDAQRTALKQAFGME